MSVLRVEFYSVTSHSGQDFSKSLSRIKGEDDATRTVVGRGHPIKLEVCHHGNGFVDGDFMKIKVYSLGERAPLDGPSSPLTDALQGAGVGACSAFLYDESKRLLAIQYNASGPSMTGISNYIQRLAGAEFTFMPALVKDRFEERAGRIIPSTVTMKLVSVDPQVLFGPDTAAEHLLSREHRAVEIEMSVRIRHLEDAGVDPSTMKSLVEANGRAKVSDMRVVGIGKDQVEEDKLRAVLSGDYVCYENKLKMALGHYDYPTRAAFVRQAMQQKGPFALQALSAVRSVSDQRQH